MRYCVHQQWQQGLLNVSKSQRCSLTRHSWQLNSAATERVVFFMLSMKHEVSSTPNFTGILLWSRYNEFHWVLDGEPKNSICSKELHGLLQKSRLHGITLASASWDALSAEEWKAAAADTHDNGEAASRAQASHLGHSLCQCPVPSLSQLVILGSILYWKNSNVFCF